MTFYPTNRASPPHHFLHILLLFLSFCLTCDGKIIEGHQKNITCIGKEREALLEFKEHIDYDYCGLMNSWVNDNSDCCTWDGVYCSNRTNHVIGLDLRRDKSLHGGCLDSQVIGPSLSELKHLEFLDLSSNYVDGTIPSFIGSLVNLRHLNLSNSYLTGELPNQLRNLTRLTSLDLNNNEGLSAKSLNWLSRLTLLKDINLGTVDLSKVTDWSIIIGNLTLLESLEMDNCLLYTPAPSSFLKSSNLRAVSLCSNAITSLASTFQWLLRIATDPAHLKFSSNYSLLECRLKYLDLSFNSLEGSIPSSIGNFKFLITLDLSYNSLSGTIPVEIGNLRSLSYFNLYNNALTGTIPDEIGNLKFLSYFNLHNNALTGTIADEIGNLKSLSLFDLYNNSLTGVIPDSIGNLTSLTYLDLSCNSLNGIIPTTTENLKSLAYLNRNSLKGLIPSAFGNLPQLLHLDLSYNHLEGPIPCEIGYLYSVSYLDLSNNYLEGVIPTIEQLTNLTHIDFSNNYLSGHIPCRFGLYQHEPYVNFSYNNLTGPIPKYLSYAGFEPFQGNPGLRTVEHNMCKEEDGDDKFYLGLYVSFGLGLYVGFWGFCGTLTVKNSWRRAYFQFLDHIVDKIYVTVAIYLVKCWEHYVPQGVISLTKKILLTLKKITQPDPIVNILKFTRP